MRYRNWLGVGLVAGVALGAGAACASLGLGEVVQAPRISASGTQDARLDYVGPSLNNPLGAARIRIYARVENPNPFGLTLANLAGNLFLQSTEAAQVSLPLGLPMVANGDTIVPIDLTIGLDDVEGLVGVVRNALDTGRLDYRLNGTVGVDAGALGTPTFGPMNLVEGELAVFD
jgi:hypothetical protein